MPPVTGPGRAALTAAAVVAAAERVALETELRLLGAAEYRRRAADRRDCAARGRLADGWRELTIWHAPAGTATQAPAEAEARAAFDDLAERLCRRRSWSRSGGPCYTRVAVRGPDADLVLEVLAAFAGTRPGWRTERVG